MVSPSAPMVWPQGTTTSRTSPTRSYGASGPNIHVSTRGRQISGCTMSLRTLRTWVNPLSSCTGTIGLSHRNRLGMLRGNNVQRGVALNLESLYRDHRDLKSRILCDLNRIKLRSVASPRYSFERTGQCSADRGFFR